MKKNNALFSSLLLFVLLTGMSVITMASPARDTKTRDLVVTRVFDATVEQMWKAWSDSEQVKMWWGPTGFTAPVAKMNFREGASSLVCMRSPEGMEIFNTWTYKKIVPSV